MPILPYFYQMNVIRLIDIAINAAIRAGEKITEVYSSVDFHIQYKEDQRDTAAGHVILKAVGKNIYHPDLKTELSYNKEDLLNPHFIAV